MAITKTKAATKCHIEAVLRDPEFIEEFDLANKHQNKKEMMPELLKRYGFGYDDIDAIGNRFELFANPYTLFSAGYLKYSSVQNEFVANFDVDITRNQFEDLWKLIQKNKEKIGVKLTREKPPQNWELLYAIFKARRLVLKFSEIFEQYQAGELPGYKDKSTSQYKSEDSLERYYRKYYSTDA